MRKLLKDGKKAKKSIFYTLNATQSKPNVTGTLA